MKNTVRLLAFVLIFALTLPLASCEIWDEFWTEFNGGTGTSSSTTTTKKPTDTTTTDKGGDTTPPDDDMKLNDYAQPFWTGDTMYDESIMLVANTDAEGNVIEAPRAKLLFGAEKIESVKWYFHENNGSQIITFTEGEDFTYENGYIVAKGEIVYNDILEISEFSTDMPYITDKMLTGEQKFPGLTLKSDIPSKTDGLCLPFTEGYQIVQMQLSVTYTHREGLWQGTVPEYLGDSTLSKTHAKLEAGEDVNILVFGDSISTGANSSSILGIAPSLPTWPDMLAEELSTYYGASITLKNTSVGGWTSANGTGGGTGWIAGQQVQKPGLATQFASGELKGFAPDLAIIGFGMNDASVGVSIDNFCSNITSMIKTVRAQNPDCEILLLGTILANPMAKNQSKNQTEYTEYLSKIAKNHENVSVLDIGAMHADLLESGKYYTEMSSNNVNHPNDFLARVYTMNILSTLIDFEIESTKTDDTTYGKYISRGYSALFADPFMKNGISIMKPDGTIAGTVAGTAATGEASWVFSQWGSKYDLYNYADRSFFNGGEAFTYISDGKRIDGETLPGKILTIDSTNGSVYMELNAETEYDAPRQNGEGWPHTLISQDFGPDLVHVSELSDLVMNMTYEITKFEDCMGSTADPDAHCAQLVWYITVQNRTQGHKDYGKYVWFGITLWDNRSSGAVSNGFAAEDAGKEDATHSFIYQPSSMIVHSDGKCPVVGQKRTVDFHMLEVVRTAFNTAKSRGYLGDTEWDDLYIGGMNFGFEVTGTYNVATQIDSVGIYYK